MRASFLIKCVLLIVGGCSLAACSGGKRYYESVGSIFHTRYSIKYEADEAKDSLILAELERFDRSLNPFNPNSVIAKVNRGEPVEVDPWFREVFLKAMEVSAVSDGGLSRLRRGLRHHLCPARQPLGVWLQPDG